MSDVILICTKNEPEEGKTPFIPVFLPLGILRLASILIKKGYQIKIIDQRVEVDWKVELKKQLKKGAICAGISCLSGMPIKFGLEASKICKDYNIKTVWGGVHPTLDPYTTIKNKYVDFVVKGEGEFTFCSLVDALEERKELNNIKGLLFKDDGEIKETPDAPYIDLNTLPTIPFNLLDLNKYKRKKYRFIKSEGPMFPLETSRGCPYNCRFCSRINKGWRAITANRIIDELKYIRDNFTRNVEIVDENFFSDHKRIKELLDLIKKEKINMNIRAGFRMDYILKHPDLINELESCGFKYLIISIDATSQRMLNLVNKYKQLNVSQILNLNRNLNKKSIAVNYPMITGFPYESIEDIKEGFLLGLKLLLENKNARVGVSKFMPLPGIDILKDCIKLGFKKPNKLEKWCIYSSYRWQSKSPWLNGEAQGFLGKFEYIRGLFFLREYGFPLANQIIWFFGSLMKARIKNDYYKFNFEQGIANIVRYLTKRVLAKK